MANDIYTTTHDGLAALVSSKAATQLLDRALSAKGFRADKVSRQQMKAVLLGPVVRELEGILPTAGVEHNLRRIYMSLPRPESDVSKRARHIISSPEVLSTPKEDDTGVEAFDMDVNIKARVEAEAPPVAAQADSAEQADVMNQLNAAYHVDSAQTTPSAESGMSELALAAARVDALAAVSVETFAAEASNIPVRDEPADVGVAGKTELEAVLGAPPTEVTQVANATKAPRRMLSVNTEDELSAVVLKFAKLENARLVMGMRANGEIVLARGSAEDLDAIARLGALGLKLLSRSGEIRSYYLAHSRSQLFLFPLGAYAVTVIGTNDLNLGEVFSTLTLLEEDV